MSLAVHPGLWSKRPLLLVVALALEAFAAITFLSAQDKESLTADQVKAGFIYNFTRYVEWPSPGDADPAHLHICAAGADGVIDQLEIAVHGKVVDNRRILVRRLGDAADLNSCELLYVGMISRKEEQQFATAVAGLPVLTVGSKPGFLRGAAMLTFVLEENRVRFDIDLALASKANIRFDSRLLALARRTNGG